MLPTAFGLHVLACGSIFHCDLKKGKRTLKPVCVEENVHSSDATVQQMPRMTFLPVFISAFEMKAGQH